MATHRPEWGEYNIDQNTVIRFDHGRNLFFVDNEAYRYNDIKSKIVTKLVVDKHIEEYVSTVQHHIRAVLTNPQAHGRNIGNNGKNIERSIVFEDSPAGSKVTVELVPSDKEHDEVYRLLSEFDLRNLKARGVIAPVAPNEPTSGAVHIWHGSDKLNKDGSITLGKKSPFISVSHKKSDVKALSSRANQPEKNEAWRTPYDKQVIAKISLDKIRSNKALIIDPAKWYTGTPKEWGKKFSELLIDVPYIDASAIMELYKVRLKPHPLNNRKTIIDWHPVSMF